MGKSTDRIYDRCPISFSWVIELPIFSQGGVCHSLVGALEPLELIDHSQVAFHRRSISGLTISGIAQTQEVLDFCYEAKPNRIGWLL